MSESSHRNVSGQSTSTTLSEGITRALKYTSLSEPLPEENEESALLLKRNLSTKSVVSTTSSYAQRMQKAALDVGGGKMTLRTIGLGSCGTVFEVPGTELAYKKGNIESDILRDYRLTRKVHASVAHVHSLLQQAYPDLEIPKTPQCYDFYTTNDDDFWSRNLQRFPVSHRSKQPLFTVDHILPLPKATREALIETYFDEDEEIQQEAKDEQDNKDCLVRIYLGERESTKQQSESYDSLRNFPLRLNMMEDLDMDTSDLAKEMALGLAIIHWQAQVDGMDVEFVLGSSNTRDDSSTLTPATTGEALNFQSRATHLFMFDFDKATDIELTGHDVSKKLVPAFLGNDPYYPLPQVDEDLWEDFCSAYLGASKLIMEANKADKAAKTLPEFFVTEVLSVLKENEDWSEDKNIVFAQC